MTKLFENFIISHIIVFTFGSFQIQEEKIEKEYFKGKIKKKNAPLAIKIQF